MWWTRRAMSMMRLERFELSIYGLKARCHTTWLQTLIISVFYTFVSVFVSWHVSPIIFYYSPIIVQYWRILGNHGVEPCLPPYQRGFLPMKEFPLCLFPGTFGVKGVPVSFYSYSFPKYRRRVSNPRPSVCKTDALPLSYSGIYGGYRIWTCVDGLWDHAGASPVQPANRKRKTRTSPLPPWGSVQTLTLRSRYQLSGFESAVLWSMTTGRFKTLKPSDGFEPP